MVAEVLKHAGSDGTLKGLLEEAEGLARVYMLAKGRQKGCDGMGEVATLKDEFRTAVAELIKYCLTKGYLKEVGSYDDIDSIANEIVRR